jgi:hypothetical protein
MAVFGLFSAFLLTAFAAVQANRQGLLNTNKLIPLFAIGTCAYILGICFANIIKLGISIPFLSFFIGGCLLAIYKYCSSKCVKKEVLS